MVSRMQISTLFVFLFICLSSKALITTTPEKIIAHVAATYDMTLPPDSSQVLGKLLNFIIF